MFRVVLINMPFASLRMPSLALTQLSSVIAKQFGDRISVETLYPNQDFAHYLGVTLYEQISNSLDHHASGIGEWFFRQAAFPELADNTKEYFRRYYPRSDQHSLALKAVISEKREGIADFLDQLATHHHLDEADIVGFTSMFAQNVASFALCRRLKERNPSIITAIGGANCEIPMGLEIAKNVEVIDFVFSGFALSSFPEFVRRCLEGKRDTCHVIQGVFSRQNCNGSSPAVLGEEVDVDTPIELDYQPFLATFFKNFPKSEVKPALLFETSRGCWWGERAHCTFCGLNGLTMKYRAMNPENALRQFESLFKHSRTCSLFECVDNIMPVNYLTDVFPLMAPPANASIFYEVKADLTEEELKILSKAHVTSVQPGIEALATSTLKLMRKGTSVFQNLRFLKGCVSNGVTPVWNLLIGFPGEEEGVYEKYSRDIPLLSHLPPPTGVYPVRFDRYSPYFTQAQQYGLDLHPFDCYALTYPFSSESLKNFAYYFADHSLGTYMLAASKWIDRLTVQVQAWRSRWGARNARSTEDGGKKRPELFLRREGHSWLVVDSRATYTEFEISPLAATVLRVLEVPHKQAELASLLGSVQEDVLEEQIAFFETHGLIFREGERVLSLCSDGCAGPVRDLEAVARVRIPS